MPISFRCECNRTLKVADTHAGKRVRCPGCNGTPTVPMPEADSGFDVVDDEDDAPPPPPAKRATVAKAVAKPAKPANDSGYEIVDDDDDDTPKKKPKSSSKYNHGDDEDDDDDDSPRRKAKRKRERAIAKVKNKPSDGKRMLYIIGGALGLLIGCGIAYWAWNSDIRRPGRLIGLGVAIAFCGVGGMYNGATGNIDSDETDDSSDSDSDD